MLKENFNVITGNRFFSPESDREKQTKVVQSGIDEQLGNIKSFDPTIKNPFKDYKLDFDYNTMDKNLDDSFNKTVAGINTDAKNDIASTKQGTIRSLASRGITGGSIVDDTINKNINPIMTTKSNTIRDLATTKLDKKAALMDLFNRYGIDLTSKEAGIDFNNIQNLFNKNSQLASLLGMNVNNLQNYSDSTWLDDLFAGIEAGSGFVESGLKALSGVPDVPTGNKAGAAKFIG